MRLSSAIPLTVVLLSSAVQANPNPNPLFGFGSDDDDGESGKASGSDLVKLINELPRCIMPCLVKIARKNQCTAPGSIAVGTGTGTETRDIAEESLNRRQAGNANAVAPGGGQTFINVRCVCGNGLASMIGLPSLFTVVGMSDCLTDDVKNTDTDATDLSCGLVKTGIAGIRICSAASDANTQQITEAGNILKGVSNFQLNLQTANLKIDGTGNVTSITRKITNSLGITNTNDPSGSTASFRSVPLSKRDYVLTGTLVVFVGYALAFM
ncbi:hypothetical protein B0T26DRAFT_343336 [Lasiosphaeria miniovina]|uniref:Uncharacterized protein n=1 Tax=Lasiosphaeria miniovina TaxID=1954250 RepID=A0AA40ABD4_9PEZI|nr:uncharacterized protein B0T26DRAFT_343336 [Lasiosphaeria miniovina]KAK0712674.1 hypothetical protein B0T26DRAFT_343336 [Lasiosphaeria miniovina]